MKGRERVMSLEAELAHHTHQLSDARATLDSQSSQVQVSVRVSLMWLCCHHHPQPPLSGTTETAEVSGGGAGVCKGGLCSGCR